MSLPNSELREALCLERCIVRENVPLAPLLHVRLGGPAAFFAEPLSEDAVVALVERCRDLDVPLRVLGGGSNLIVADAGVPGVVMTLSRLNRLVRDERRVTAGAGVSLATLMRATRELGLAGLEVLCGIPAQVGGAVAMNAGTAEGSTFDRLVSLTLVDRDARVRVLGPDDFAPRYRDGGLGDAIALHATFELDQGDPEEIFARFERSLKRRNATQPVTQRSVGCVFKNPEGASAGQLIERAGCKLLRRGGISVSGVHANYFVNDDSGTTADFLALVADVQARVRADSGAELVPEVKMWGV